MSGKARLSLGLFGLVAAVAASWAVWQYLGQSTDPALPQNPQLQSEGFGSAITLGMSRDEAQRTVAKAKFDTLFVTLEELTERNPYVERQPKADLLAVTYAADETGIERVEGLRGYLALPEHSTLTLAGQPAAHLSSDEVKQIFGEPFNATTGQDARTHLTYYFADPHSTGMAYRLTTSHEYDGSMFALALERDFAPQ